MISFKTTVSISSLLKPRPPPSSSLQRSLHPTAGLTGLEICFQRRSAHGRGNSARLAFDGVTSREFPHRLLKFDVRIHLSGKTCLCGCAAASGLICSKVRIEHRETEMTFSLGNEEFSDL